MSSSMVNGTGGLIDRVVQTFTKHSGGYWAGYWEPHSSSVDFCEGNYLQSNYVVEFHNTWSNMSFLLGLYGLFCNNPTKEHRFSLFYITNTIIGIGSAGLHGTLHWVFQSADELPMIYVVICAYYIIAEIDTPIGMCKYPYLPHLLFTFAIFNTMVYYTYQQLYAVFLLTFSALLYSFLYCFYRLLRQYQHVKIINHVCTKMIPATYLIAFPSWVFDMLFCRSVVAPLSNWLPGPLKGLTPHVIWHIVVAYFSYLIIFVLICCRMEILNLKYAVQWKLFGCVPVTIANAESNERDHLIVKNSKELNQNIEKVSCKNGTTYHRATTL